jgi:hypothetical protein
MKILSLLAFLALFVSAAPTFASETCDQMKDRIDTQIKGHGVKDYSLDIVAKGQAQDGKAVASCDKGSKEIVYKKK